MKCRTAVTTLLLVSLPSLAMAAPGSWRGTITMSASDYTPNFPGEVKPLKVFQQIADEYEKKYPGIKIKFHTEPIPDTNTMTSFRARAMTCSMAPRGQKMETVWLDTVFITV